MNADELLPWLDTHDFGREAYFFASVASTQDIAVDLARRGCAHGTLVHSEQQTAGRGRQGRSWSSGRAEQSLVFSLVLQRQIIPDQGFHWGFVVGLGGRAALAQWVSEPVRLKWPNDLWCRERKIGGMLASLE